MSAVLFAAILAVSAAVTSFISGVLGMAGGMVLMGVLLALMPVPAAMMLHGITQFAANGWRAFLWRAHVDWRIFRGYAWGALGMLAAFSAVQVVVSKPVALIAMGLTPFVTLLLPERLVLNVERPGQPVACGMVCTVLSLTAGISGPILDSFFVRSSMGRHAVVATKAMTQGVSHLSKIAYFGAIAAAGEASGVDAWIAAMMVALAFAGTSVSALVLKRMNDASFRRWTRWTVMTLGLFYVGSGALMLAR